MKGVLIRKWCGSKQLAWEIAQNERNGAISSTSWSESGVSEITAAVSDENVVARHKQQWDDREHNNGNGLKIEIK